VLIRDNDYLVKESAGGEVMSASKTFGRFIPAMITPFDKDLDLDLDRAQELAVSLVKRGSDALIINGTTGESPTVFYPQKIELFKAVIAAVGDLVPVIANVGDNCTADSVEFAQDVIKLGVDGIMAVVPYYNKPPQEGLFRHFKCIAQAAEVPMILYNIPGRCVINMEAETTLRLAHDIENIVAVKEASGKFDQIKQIVDEAPDGFAVYSGDDEATLPIMELGGYGVISTIGNVAPERMKEIVTAMAKGDHTAALSAHLKLQPLMKELFITSNPIMVKEALKLLGFDCGGVRLPLVDATPEQSAELAEIMKAVGVL
jgi:4-hydroxy-tetrahydrodipicolinate synthase